MKIKNLQYVFKTLLLCFFPLLLNAQSFSEREITTRSFKINPQTTIEVNNKYGKVQVLPWEKDSVKFEIDLSISSNSLSRLKKTKEAIDFEFTSTRYYITAMTDFGSTGNKIFTELKNLSDALIPGKNTIEINYRIYCPESANLSIINKFGDVYIDDLSGEVNISLSNGDMRINSLSGSSQIELNFGNALINHLGDASFTVSYSDVNVKLVEKMAAFSKSSTLTIDKADYLRLDSRRDNYFLSSVHTIQGNTNFSRIWIDDLTCQVNMDLKFGDLTIDKIRQGFCKLDILSEYTDLTIYLEEETIYDADIFHHKDVYLTLPGDKHDIKLTTVRKSEDEFHSFFDTGNAEEIPQIKIEAKEKCYLNINHK